MTQQSAGMRAHLTLAAQLATRMRHIISIVLGIEQFATETIVIARHFFRHILTGWATPTVL